MSKFQRLAIVTAAATYLLIVVGAVVRVTGSGLGCPDWPLCHGGLIPPLEITAIFEYIHRVVGATVSLLMVVTVAAAWMWHRAERPIALPASSVPVLLALEIVLGGVVVLLELPPVVVVVHLAIAMLILGVLVWLAVAAGPPPRLLGPAQPGSRYHRLAWATSGAVLALIMTGAYVMGASATWACAGFPDCNGEALPFGASDLINIHLFHRLVAYAVTLMVAITMVQAWRTQRHVPAVMTAASALGIAIVVQIALGATAVLTGVPPLLRGLHVAGATAVWVSAVALASVSQWSLRASLPRSEAGGPPPAPPSAQRPLRDTARAYLSLTKPRIIGLLLLTTLGSMLIAAKGLPQPALILFTLLGGALSAGAANAFNCLIDRDIDGLMARTVVRPLPSGVLTPAQALRFGLLMAVLAFAVLMIFVNLLAAALSLLGLLYYVFVYTRWLKRSSPLNIVVGGVAGAVPPLVGWAAVTGEVSLLAFLLFFIIFYWTPPHFWALALLIRREYERAGIPMLPVVRGEAETRQQILLYTLLLVALTLILVPLQMMGLFYLFAALVLGGVFVYFAARLLREATALAASRLYRYSMAYLALLFTAIVLDQRVFA